MVRARSSFLVLLGLLLASLVPALYVLEWLVDSSGRRASRLEGTLEVRLEGQQPLSMVTSLSADTTGPGLHLHGRGELRHDVYPWEATGLVGFLTLELPPDLLAAGPTVEQTGFAASFRVASQVGGRGGPSTPCLGTIRVGELAPARADIRLEELSALNLQVALRCPTPPEPGEDARAWTLVGPLELTRRPL